MHTLPTDVVCAHEAAAHVLSAAEAEACSIHDIVMPLPGFDVIYPSHPGKKLLRVISFVCPWPA